MYIKLSEEEKYVKREYRRNWYLRKSKEKKQKLKEHLRNYCEANKNKKTCFSWI